MSGTLGEQAKCSVCKVRRPVAKISGKYYCYECGSKLVKEHILAILKELEKRGVRVD